MMAAIATIALAGCGAVFNVVPIPLETPSAQTFAIDVDNDRIAEMAVLAGHTLNIYSIDTGTRRFSVALPQDTSVFDMFDADEDGAAEIVALEAGRVLLMELEGGAPPRELFRADDLLDHGSGSPAPHILATQRGGARLLAVPRKSALELRTLEGELVESHPLDTAKQSPAPFERPFLARTAYPNQVAPPGAIEMHIDQVVIHDVPAATGVFSLGDPGLRHPGSPVHMRASEEDGYQRWPWFSLMAQEDALDRVLYALCEPDYEDTLIRIQRPVTDQPGATGESRVSPARRYRGCLVPPWQTLPDFNGDGYTDLLLWIAPQPGRSIEAVTRAVASRTWPLQLLAHCFDPAKNRYEPRSTGILKTRVPVWWFVRPERGMPLHLHIMGDFNGDGHTDIAFATDINEFTAWLYTDGFPAQPSFHFTFPENLQGLESQEALDGTGRLTPVLRGERTVYILRPAGDS